MSVEHSVKKSLVDHDFLFLFYASTKTVNRKQYFESRALKFDRRERKGRIEFDRCDESRLVSSLDMIQHPLHKST